LHAISNDSKDFAGIGVPTHLLLREDEFSIDGNVEGSATGRYQFNRLDGMGPPNGISKRLYKFGRQTGGLGGVVSLHTEGDRQFHPSIVAAG